MRKLAPRPGAIAGAMEETVRRMAADGESGSAIAAAIGKTRSAVLGWCFRNGVKLGGTQADGGRRARPARKERTVPLKRLRNEFVEVRPLAQPAPIPAPSPAPVEAVPVHLFDRQAGQCAWPLWGDGERTLMYCGAASEEGRSYCPGHLKVGFQPLPTRRGRRELV